MRGDLQLDPVRFQDSPDLVSFSFHTDLSYGAYEHYRGSVREREGGGGGCKEDVAS